MAGKICMGCMQRISAEANICPLCGHDFVKFTQPEFALPLGAQLHGGKYMVGKVLGQGGFGITYVGLDQPLGLKVAVKEYYPVSMASRSGIANSLLWHTTAENREAGRESFVREAQKMAKTHRISNVVEVRDIFFENETAYIVMDFVEGETLKARLERTGPMSVEECVNLLLPVMKALEKAHSRGMIHRDISPDNIMIDPDGDVWLLDLGAAKELDPVSASATQSSQLVVKRGFSPPEQSASSGRIGPWTDVYAMCATIYYCVTGQVLPEAMDRMMGAQVDYPDTIASSLRGVFERGLELRPDARIQSMGELMNVLNGMTESGDEEDPQITAQIVDDISEAQKLDKFAVTAPVGRASSAENMSEQADPDSPKDKKARPKWLIPAVGAAAVLAVSVGAILSNGGTANPDVAVKDETQELQSIETSGEINDHMSETDAMSSGSDSEIEAVSGQPEASDKTEPDTELETTPIEDGTVTAAAIIGGETAEDPTKKAEEEAAAKKAEEEAAAKKKAEEEATAKKADEEADLKKKAESGKAYDMLDLAHYYY